ncbi:apolipoprotein N-acyltransferase [Rhodobacter sp. Har01]|uniref:apolipoprotein N-acyltransferase n=1 Tax=Rhodobacter sp. Har01 TaxID=2883999 RepID=UPI001D08E0C4|nr:apolipoprotein N-acyltransferase [Rhodobacter sp. Har01]MCB6178289.1 apolipoprotein N-acyltransferase [Rhodobacter sp. Har01]
MRPGPRTALRDAAIGVAIALGQAPLGLWPVALAGLGLALGRMAGAAGPGAAFRRGWMIGAGHFAFALAWIVQPFFVDPERHGWMAPFALVGMAFGLGLFWGAAAWGARRLGGGAVAVALAWAAVELARGQVLTGFPWALPGHIWLDTPLMQTAALIGANGMTAATLLALAAPLAWGRKGLAVPALALAVVAGWSWHRLALPEPPAPGGSVRLVQPNIAQTLKWDPDEARANFDTLLALSAAAPVELIVWPETAVPFILTEGQGAALAMAGVAGGTPLAAGIQRVEGELAWNSLAVIGPGGRIGPTYDKIHLVPFGEYVPFGDLAYDWFGIRAFAAQAGAAYMAGSTRRPVDFGPGLGRALPAICYEAIFAQELAAAPRGDWLLQITNDAWFGTLTGPYQHYAQARLRAVELGLPLVRVANTGVSAVTDARGRIVAGLDGAPALLPLGARGVLDVALPGALPPPPYARIGDGPLTALLLAGLFLPALLRLRRNGA